MGTSKAKRWHCSLLRESKAISHLKVSEIGEQSGRKENPRQVSQDMRKAKGENGERLFSREEWLRVANLSLNTRIFLLFVFLEKEMGRSVLKHNG